LSNIGLGEQKAYFIENLAMLIGYGQNIITSLEAIKLELKSRRMVKMVDSLISDIGAGQPLSAALAKTNFFAKKIITLIRIGETTGKLKDNLKVVVRQQQKDKLFRDNLRSAMLYPFFVFSITLIVGVFIVWFFLPILASVFIDLNIPLPLITQILIAIALFLQVYGYIVIPLFLLAVFILVYLIFFNAKTKFIGQTLIFKIPVFRRLISQIELARFGYTLGSLLASGLSLNDVFESLAQSALFYRYRHFYNFLKDKIDEGYSFEKSFKEYDNLAPLFSHPVQQMIVAAEQSGQLIDISFKIGEIYEEKIAITTKNAATLLEPVLLVIVWLGVLLIGISVILPIYSLVGQINP